MACVGTSIIGRPRPLSSYRRATSPRPPSTPSIVKSPFAGASHRSFAWINANHKLPETYHQLNKAGIHAHAQFQESVLDQRRVEGDSPLQPWFHQTGSIMADLGTERQETYGQRLEESRSLGYPVEVIDRQQLHKLEPSIAWPQDLESALYFPMEAWLDQQGLADELLRQLEHHGVRLTVREVIEVIPGPQGARVVFRDGPQTRGDKVVLAAGAWSRQIGERSGFTIPTADLGEQSTRTHSLIGVTKPTDAMLNRVIISSAMNVRPRNDGRFWVQIPAMEERVVEGETAELLEDTSTVMRQRLREFFGVEIELEKVYYSGRSFPIDGLSIVGYLDDHETIYAEVTHSGMTLAMILAELVEQELSGTPSTMLDNFRPQRFDHGNAPEADWDYFIGKQ
ncbi:FAD-binding oxidoreductase [Auritidibacter ignavus]|nr:FAD-dependent oxidoreductase [Auritidibacter ignavus]RMX22941.1 FAD-binding oxidoreductase [Auritidibacter ignavus]